MTDFELSRRARRDLLGHADALSDYSERAALDFIETMEAAFVQLEEFPESGSGGPNSGQASEHSPEACGSCFTVTVAVESTSFEY